MTNKEYTAKLIQKERLNSDTFLLTLENKDLVQQARPGQFVNVGCDELLKRPFGIAHTDMETGTFQIGVKIVGKGTKQITDLSENSEVEVLGPLGNGFVLSGEDFILAGGGTGVFPINFVKEELIKSGKNVTVVQGGRDKEQLILTGEDYILTTDNGTAGIKGTVIDGLNTIEDIKADTKVLCVGPAPMMKAVGQWSEEHNLKCFVSLEQRMACGIGICLCCTVKIKGEAESFEHKRCCKDGPVFEYGEVIR